MVITLLAPTARPARDSLDDLLLRGTGHILPRLEALKSRVEDGEGRPLAADGMPVDTDSSSESDLDTTQELEVAEGGEQHQDRDEPRGAEGRQDQGPGGARQEDGQGAEEAQQEEDPRSGGARQEEAQQDEAQQGGAQQDDARQGEARQDVQGQGPREEQREEARAIPWLARQEDGSLRIVPGPEPASPHLRQGGRQPPQLPAGLEVVAVPEDGQELQLANIPSPRVEVINLDDDQADVVRPRSPIMLGLDDAMMVGPQPQDLQRRLLHHLHREVNSFHNRMGGVAGAGPQQRGRPRSRGRAARRRSGSGGDLARIQHRLDVVTEQRRRMARRQRSVRAEMNSLAAERIVLEADRNQGMRRLILGRGRGVEPIRVNPIPGHGGVRPILDLQQPQGPIGRGRGRGRGQDRRPGTLELVLRPGEGEVVRLRQAGDPRPAAGRGGANTRDPRVRRLEARQRMRQDQV